MKILLQIFKRMEKSEFRVDKTLLSDGIKIRFKESNGLIRVIQTLLHWKQWLRDGMLTLNTVIQAQMMLNTQVAQIWQLSCKIPKNFPWICFGQTQIEVVWDSRGVKDIRKQCIHHFAWTFAMRKLCLKRVCSHSIKNNNVIVIVNKFLLPNCLLFGSFSCNFYNASFSLQYTVGKISISSLADFLSLPHYKNRNSL